MTSWKWRFAEFLVWQVSAVICAVCGVASGVFGWVPPMELVATVAFWALCFGAQGRAWEISHREFQHAQKEQSQ